MPSINDIPELYKKISAKPRLLSWLLSLPVDDYIKRDLIQRWIAHTGGEFTRADYMLAGLD